MRGHVADSWLSRRVVEMTCCTVLALGPLCLLTYTSVRLGDEAVRDQVQARIAEASSAASTLVAQQMEDLASLVTSSASRPELASALVGGAPSGGPPAPPRPTPAVLSTPPHPPMTAAGFLAGYLTNLRASDSAIALVFVVDASGHLISAVPSSPSVIGKDLSYRNWYKGAVASGRTYISEAYQTVLTGHARVVAAAAPIRGPAAPGGRGATLGYLVAAYSLTTIDSFVTQFAEANHVAVIVTDQHGTVLAAPHSSGTGRLVSDRHDPAVLAGLAGRAGELTVGSGSSASLDAYRPVTSLGWTVQAEISAAAVNASSEHWRVTVEAIAGGLALVLVCGLVLLGLTFRRRDQAEQQMRESENFLDSVVENIPDMVFIKDAAELRLVRVNRAMEQILGYRRDELLGKNNFDLFSTEQAEFYASADRVVLEERTIIDVAEETTTTKSGEVRVIHTKKLPLLGPDGTPRFMLGISEDITERHATQQALAQAKEEAEKANQAKNEFLSRTSHELRTPLNAILGFAQLLEMSELGELDRDNNAQILKAGRHLLTLINELLDLSRIESGELSLSLEPVTLVAVIDEVTTLMGPLAAARAITISPRSNDDTLAARADRQRLSQILLNLVSNAVKYNREGGSIEITSRVGPDGSAEIAVIDTGPGLSSGDLERIFLPFERLHAAGSGIEGAGIGLTLSAALAQAMGGWISVDSEIGRGTTFVLHIPQADTTGPGSPAPLVADDSTAPTDRAGRHQLPSLLYVEDNLANVQIIERFLATRPGTQLYTSMSGQIGVDLARQHHPSVILLDLHLPDLSGDQVFERLRADPDTATIPVIILSADATKGAVNRLLARGVTAYLTKPLDLAELGGILDALELVDQPATS
jgi:PAS domain S-box-containing protein